MTKQEYYQSILKTINEQQFETILTYPDYYKCSNLGLIKSLERLIIYKDGRKKLLKEKILRPSQNPNGYFVVHLWKNGSGKTHLVNQLVCTAFHGSCPPGMECRHIDGNPWNNNADNLCWGTHAENEADKIINGTTNRGKQNGMSKLNNDQVNEIRQLWATGDYYQKELAELFNVCISRISLIVNNKAWKHLLI